MESEEPAKLLFSSATVQLLTPLELVVSLPLADAAALMQTSLKRLQQLAQHPGHLRLLMLPPAQTESPAGSAFMLSNQSGLTATAWLSHSSSAESISHSKGKTGTICHLEGKALLPPG